MPRTFYSTGYQDATIVVGDNWEGYFAEMLIYEMSSSLSDIANEFDTYHGNCTCAPQKWTSNRIALTYDWENTNKNIIWVNGNWEWLELSWENPCTYGCQDGCEAGSSYYSNCINSAGVSHNECLTYGDGDNGLALFEFKFTEEHNFTTIVAEYVDLNNGVTARMDPGSHPPIPVNQRGLYF